MSTYYVGTIVNVTGTFLDVNDNAVDPTQVYIDVQLGLDQPTVTYAYPGSGWTKQGTGIYLFAIDTSGIEEQTQVTCQMRGLGAVQAVAPHVFNVNPLPLGFP
jgi:hypothetical protein